MFFNRHQINSVHSVSNDFAHQKKFVKKLLKMASKELRKKIVNSVVLNDKICLSESSSELFCRNETDHNFSNSFAALIFWYFSIKRKVCKENSFDTLLESILRVSFRA